MCFCVCDVRVHLYKSIIAEQSYEPCFSESLRDTSFSHFFILLFYFPFNQNHPNTAGLHRAWAGKGMLHFIFHSIHFTSLFPASNMLLKWTVKKKERKKENQTVLFVKVMFRLGMHNYFGIRSVSVKIDTCWHIGQHWRCYFKNQLKSMNLIYSQSYTGVNSLPLVVVNVLSS